MSWIQLSKAIPYRISSSDPVVSHNIQNLRAHCDDIASFYIF